MISPMQRVSTLVSRDIGNYLTNKETWGDIVINVKSYGVVGDGVTDDTAALNEAFADSNGKRIEILPDMNCLITGQITMPENATINCMGQITCVGDQEYWFYANQPSRIIFERFKATHVTPFSQRSLLNRIIRCEYPTYFEVKSAEIIGASTAIHCLYGDDFICGDIILRDVLGSDAQYGYGVNSSAKRTNIQSITAINSDTSNGRHALYINGDTPQEANIQSIYVYNWNKHPVQIAITDINAACYVYIGNAVFINANIAPTADTSGCVHLTNANGPGVRVTVDDMRVKNIAGPAFGSQGTSDGLYLGNLYAEDLAVAAFINTYLVNIRYGKNNQIGKVTCTSLNTNWLAVVFLRDTVNGIVDDVYLGGSSPSGATAVRLNTADALIGNVQTESLNKLFQTGSVTVRYKQTLVTYSYANAAPTSGTWRRGDIVWNTAPTAGGIVGWICVTAGSPGTWKSFGAIEA